NRFLFEKSQHRVRFYHKMHLPLTTTIIPIYLERCKRKSGNLPLTFRGKMRNLISCETRLTRRTIRHDRFETKEETGHDQQRSLSSRGRADRRGRRRGRSAPAFSRYGRDP